MREHKNFKSRSLKRAYHCVYIDFSLDVPARTRVASHNKNIQGLFTIKYERNVQKLKVSHVSIMANYSTISLSEYKSNKNDIVIKHIFIKCNISFLLVKPKILDVYV